MREQVHREEEVNNNRRNPTRRLWPRGFFFKGIVLSLIHNPYVLNLMLFIADLHIHSKYSRATSPQMNLEDLDAWADDKGILVMATGDFLHGRYLREIKEKLELAEPGLYKLKAKYKKRTLKDTYSKTRFILSVEISSIYSQGGKVRRIHNLVFAPSIEIAEKLRNELLAQGCNLDSDGRPIIGLSSEKLAEIVFNIDLQNVIVPAHAWTPWFSIFGSMSGFDSIEECFGKYSDKIFAIETGLSSDPAMNWRLSKLDKVALISNSDSHSLPKIGREANIFDTPLTYEGIMTAIKNSSPHARQARAAQINSDNAQIKSDKIRDNQSLDQSKSELVATIEFFPEEGKYHYDGHREHQIFWAPEETKRNKGICTVCGKPVTVGVMNRVDQLADRKIKLSSKGNYHKDSGFVPYYNLVGLEEIIAEAFGVSATSKKVKEEFKNLIIKFGSELKILLKTSDEELKDGMDPKIFAGIKRVREGKLTIKPGYDGEYGVVKIFPAEGEFASSGNESKKKKMENKGKLF